MMNEKWNVLQIDEQGRGQYRDLQIGDYTLLHNPDNTCTPYCAAYKYDKSDNTWAQGHYFTTLSGALEYAVFNR